MSGATTTLAAPTLPASPLQDPAFTALLPYSASLCAELARIQADGLAVEWGRAGGGTFYDPPMPASCSMNVRTTMVRQ